MAERLTKKDYMDWSNGTGYYNQKQANQITEIEHKLGKLEDIIEKYGIESVEELDKRLMKIHNEWCCQEADRLKTEIDRDIWKKACELAVGVLRYNKGYSAIKDDLYFLKNNSTYEHCFRNPKTVDYFYQQAQEEMQNV